MNPPAKPSPPTEVLAGVDIGGTTTQVVLCTTGLHLVERLRLPTPAAEGGAAMIRTVLGALRRLLDATHARLLGVGVGAAGVVDSRSGHVIAASDSFHGWAGFPVAPTLEDALGVPAFLDNDVNAFLRAEASIGSAEGEADVLGMTLGTGVGGALWIDGALLHGPHGAAGEVGHIPGFGDLPCTCGGRGHLETLASGRSVAARYAERAGRHTTAHGVAAAAAGGDQHAVAVFQAAGAAIARALLITAGLLDVTSVVIGGGLTRAWHLLEPPILAALRAEPPVSGQQLRVARGRLGDDAAAIGAAALARAHLGLAGTARTPASCAARPAHAVAHRSSGA